MSQISATSQLATLIRSQIAAQVRTDGERSKTLGKESKVSAAAATSRELYAKANVSHHAAQTLQDLVARRVQALGPDTPNRSHAAFRIFMEAVLLQEFGRSLVNSPGFDGLVTQVIEQMASDAALDKLMEQAGNALVESESKSGLSSNASARKGKP